MTIIQILHKLLLEGIIPGVGSVLSFIPTIAIAVFILSLLRQCGIIRSCLSYFITGFSCSVPAILSCSSIPDKKQRYLTMVLIPYMSCSAKLPIYVMLTSAFFPVYPYVTICAIYSVGILTALALYALSGIFINPETSVSYAKRTRPPAEGSGLCKRLRRPSMRIVLKEVYDCCVGFLKKAFTVILIGAAIIWFLQNLSPELSFTSDIKNSLLARLGMTVSPLLAPLGFGDWRASAALISGIYAKEAVVSTFAVVAGAAEGPALYMMLDEIFSPLSAFCFMIFCLLYMPCIATAAAIKKITGKMSVSIAVMAGQTLLAWCVTFLIFHSIKVII